MPRTTRPLRIAMVASEAAPFAKTGGLGDVSSALTRALAQAGHDVRLFLPLYKSVKPSGQRFTPVGFLTDVPLTMGGRPYRFTVFTASLPGGGPPVYFVGCPALYDRGGIYASDGDEHLRFGFLTRAALESLQRMGFAPDIVHAHDWHAALAPLYLKTLYAWDHRLFGRTQTVLTLHNLAYQGGFPAASLADLDLARFASWLHQDQLRQGAFSFLVSGLLHADAVTAVSETYAREIQTPTHGFGLDGLLRARSSSVFGIANGIDADEWNPATDPFVAERYSAKDLGGKTRCRAALLREAGLSDGPAPVVGIVSRLSAQKGFDLALEVLPGFLAAGRLSLVGLGSGSEMIARSFLDLARRFPRAVAFQTGFSNEMAHRIEAGADLFLMPSRFEPCGLNQMYSQRYGTPPVVHRTGGLADTVDPWNPRSGEGTGFSFEHFTATGLTWALDQALQCFADPAAFRRVQLAGMRRDFSWERHVTQYERLYAGLLVRSQS